MATLERKLSEAAKWGFAPEISSLLKDNPALNANWANENHWTALHWATYKGHVDAVKLFLGHSSVRVNIRNKDGYSPFLLACMNGHVTAVQLMLKDARIDVTLTDNNGCSPLWYAACTGKQEVVEWLIASGRDLGDISNAKGKQFGKEFTAIEIAKKDLRPEVVALLERFVANPTQTRLQIRDNLQFPGPFFGRCRGF